LPPHLRPPLGAPARLAWQRQQQQQQRLPSGRQPLPMEPLQRIGIDIDPQPIFFQKFRWIKTFSADIRISRIYAENRKFG